MTKSDDTSRVLQLVSHDEQYAYSLNQTGIDPIILNRFDVSTPEGIEAITSRVFSEGSGEDYIASCQCGALEGNGRLGMFCQICDTVVEHNHLLDSNHLACKNWVSCPADLPNGWLTPKIYLVIAGWLSYNNGKRNYLDDLLDVDAETPFEVAEVFPGKGFGYVHDNFDAIIDYFASVHPVTHKKSEKLAILQCLSLYKDRLFCHYIPVLNAAMSPIYSTNQGRRYSDKTSDFIMSAAVSLSGLEFLPRKKKNHAYNVEKTVYKAFKDIIEYTLDATQKYLSKKRAIPRTHIFGSRFHWSIRAVVTPIVGLHEYYELRIPMRMAVNSWRVQILGVLQRKYNLNINDAYIKVLGALQQYDKDIHDICNWLIESSPFPGIPLVWDRPPSIRDGSVQLKYVTQVKEDPNDKTVEITPLDAALQNVQNGRACQKCQVTLLVNCWDIL